MAGVPSNIIVPFVGVSFDSSRAMQGSAEMPVKMLVIGQRLSAGTVAAEVPFLANTEAEVGLKAGYGSMLHRMAIKVFQNNQTVSVYFVGLDDATGTQATYAFTITGPATASGELVCYIAGNRFAVAVVNEDTATEIGDALVALINADTSLQVTAANVTGTVTLTCKNDGVAAGDLDVRFNYNEGEVFPSGVSVGAITPTAGTVDPDVADALAALGNSWYNIIVNPYDDTTNMDTLEDWLEDRAGVLTQQDSMCYQAKRDTLANLITFAEGTSRNSPYMSLLAATNRLESTYELAAVKGALVAQSILEDPAVPLHRMIVKGVKTLPSNESFDLTERNQLTLSGVSTFSDDVGVQTASCVSMYLKNDAGAPDTAYQQENVRFQLMASRWRFVNRINTKYPRAKLTNNSQGIEAGQQIMSEDIGETEAIAWFIDEQRRGNFEGGSEALQDFIDNLVVQRDEENQNRMNWFLPPNLINQFIVGSGIYQFRG